MNQEDSGNGNVVNLDAERKKRFVEKRKVIADALYDAFSKEREVTLTIHRLFRTDLLIGSAQISGTLTHVVADEEKNSGQVIIKTSGGQRSIDFAAIVGVE